MKINEVTKPYKYTDEEKAGGNWYIRYKGKNLGEPYFGAKAAHAAALAMSAKKRIPLSQLVITSSWMDAPVEEAISDTDKEGYRIPRAHRETVGCSECGKTDGLELCGTYKKVSDPMCPTCRKRWNYKWCPDCELNHIKGYCPQVGAMAGKLSGH